MNEVIQKSNFERVSDNVVGFQCLLANGIFVDATITKSKHTGFRKLHSDESVLHMPIGDFLYKIEVTYLEGSSRTDNQWNNHSYRDYDVPVAVYCALVGLATAIL